MASFASSYIKTSTVAVTRNADVLNYVLTGNIQDASGTCYAEYVKSFVDLGAASVIGGGAGARSPLFNHSGASEARFDDGTALLSGPSGVIAAGIVIKGASKWSGATRSVAHSGTVGTAGAYDGGLNMTTLSIGVTSAGGIASFWGSIRNAKVWSSALPDATLVTLTT